MAKEKGITRLDYEDRIDPKNRFDPSSDEIITQPNESFTLREIMELYTRGGELSGIPPVFEIPEVFEALGAQNLDRMSKVEKAQLALDIEEKMVLEKEKLVASKKKTFDKSVQDFIAKKVNEVLHGKEKGSQGSPEENKD